MSVPDWCVMLEKLPFGVMGAASDEYVDCSQLANEALGVNVRLGGASVGASAFVYLWRRFGPSPWPYDDDKVLAEYYIQTPIKGVILSLYPTGSGLGVGYLADPKNRIKLEGPSSEWMQALADYCDANKTGYTDINEAMANRTLMDKAKKVIGNPPWAEWCSPWRESSNKTRKYINQAIFDALREMQRPVVVRDVPINILGVVTTAKIHAEFPAYAPKSNVAGHGCIAKPKNR